MALCIAVDENMRSRAYNVANRLHMYKRVYIQYVYYVDYRCCAGVVDFDKNEIERVIGTDPKLTISTHNKIIGNIELKCLPIHEKDEQFGNSAISQVNNVNEYLVRMK